MPTVRNLLVRIRTGTRLQRTVPADRGPAATPPVRPAAPPTPPAAAPITPAPPMVRRPSPPPRRTPAPAAVPPPTPPSGRRVSKLDALTPALGRKKAGQALWAPQLLTPDERQTAARILKELDQ